MSDPENNFTFPAGWMCGKDAAKFLGVSRELFAEWVACGLIDRYEVPRGGHLKWYYKRSQLMRAVKTGRIVVPPPQPKVPEPPEYPWLTRAEAARFLGAGRDKFDTWTRERRLPSCLVPVQEDGAIVRKVRFLKADLLDAVRTNRIPLDPARKSALLRREKRQLHCSTK